jgi:DNA-binding NtrC family response regulator
MPKQILVIDRDCARRNELIEALERKGFEPIGFETGKDALQRLLFSSVHAVVLDYASSLEPNNPISAGKQLVREITDIDAFVPLILICDRCDELEHDTSAAVDLVLRRPIKAQNVVDGIHSVLSETLRERAQRKSGYIFAFR